MATDTQAYATTKQILSYTQSHSTYELKVGGKQSIIGFAVETSGYSVWEELVLSMKQIVQLVVILVSRLMGLVLVLIK